MNRATTLATATAPPTCPVAPVIIASDASLTVDRRGRGHAAWAWVDSRGRWASGQVRTTSILLAELTGVEHALGQVRDLRSPVTIVTDCMPAVNALRTLTTTGTQTISASCASHQQITQTVRRLCAALRYHPNVQVCWTLSHPRPRPRHRRGCLYDNKTATATRHANALHPAHRRTRKGKILRDGLR